MRPPTDLDRRLTAWLDEDALVPAPDHLLPEALGRTARVTPRPGWRITERWIPMRVSMALAVIPRAVLLMLTLLLLLALAASAYVASSPGPVRLPPPTGLARNGLLVYDSGGDIWLSEADGSSPRRLTDSPRNEHLPVWSPDGSRIAYWVDGDDGAALVVHDPLASDPPLVIADGLTDAAVPSWSPDGKILVYAMEADGRNRIHVARADGSGTGPIGDPGLDAKDPAWSPDGTMIAFKGGLGSPDAGVYLMAADGTGAHRLATIPVSNRLTYDTPSWSPDGTSIVTQGPAGYPRGSEVWVIPVNGGPARATTDLPGDDWLPTWSPDGRIAFVHDGESGVVPMVVDPDGSQTIELQSTPVEIRILVWSPDATKLLGYDPTRGFLILDAGGRAGPVAIHATASDWGGGWQRLAP